MLKFEEKQKSNVSPAGYLLKILRRPAIMVFLISALIRLVFGLFVLTDMRLVISAPDSTSYFRLAENLWHHGIYSRSPQPPFVLDNVITPVYPFFLAANFFLIQYLQEQKRVSLLSSALLLGLAALCRPVASYFFIITVALLFFISRQAIKVRARNVIIYIGVYALTITPWIIRNQLIFGVANMSAIQGINMLLVNTAYLKAAQENIDYARAQRLLEAEADSLLVAQGFSLAKIKGF